jgi:hypothetical protein
MHVVWFVEYSALAFISLPLAAICGISLFELFSEWWNARKLNAHFKVCKLCQDEARPKEHHGGLYCGACKQWQEVECPACGAPSSLRKGIWR